jgi:signal peptidase I
MSFITPKPTAIAKEPWLAVILSMALPGVGQVYAGSKTKGYVLMAIAIFLMVIGFGGMFHSEISANLGFGAFFIYYVFWFFNLFDAHRCAQTWNGEEAETQRRQEKDPWLAVFWSRLIPGLGHGYQGQWGWAIGFFLIAVFVTIVISGVVQLITQSDILTALLSSVVWILISYWCAYHAYINSPALREKHPNIFLRFYVPILLLDLSIGLFMGNLKSIAIESRYIPSESMLPTLKVNDRLLLNKLVYRFSNPKRGDVVVFNPTPALKEQNFKDAFIKRIIGLPGDKVAVKSGQVYINGNAIQEKYIYESPQYDFESVTVPPNSYFVLGDNRNNAYDSHYWGFVPREYVIGKATKRFWPIDRTGNIR